MSLFGTSSSSFSDLTTFDTDVSVNLTNLDSISDPTDGSYNTDLGNNIGTAITQLSTLGGFVNDISNGFINTLQTNHDSMEQSIVEYNTSRNELKNNVVIQKTMRARNFESETKPTYMLFLCWVFIFLLFISVLLLQLLEIELNVPFGFHIFFFMALLVVGYSIVKNIQAFMNMY